MLIVLFIIFLILIIIGTIFCQIKDKSYSEILYNIGSWGNTILGFCEIIVIILIIFNCIDISKLKIADRKIEMYQEENNNIQKSISTIVENYKKYEQNTYTESLKNIDIKNTNLIVLTQLYPDLKSNEMTNTQIQIYQDNNNKIKELKAQKLDKEISKWWLYFGKIE